MTLADALHSPAQRQLVFLAGVLFALLAIAVTLPRWRWSLIALAILAILFCAGIETARRLP
jgi:hypothetical protein